MQTEAFAPARAPQVAVAGEDRNLKLEVAESAQLTSSGRRHLHGGRWLQIVYVLMDVAFVSLNGVIAIAARSSPTFRMALVRILQLHLQPADQSSKFYVALLVLYTGLIIVCCQGEQLYRTLRSRSTFSESLAVVKAVSIATVLLTAFLYLSGLKSVPRLVVGLSGALNAGTLLAWRVLRRQVVRRRVKNGIGARNVLIVGAGRVGKTLAAFIGENQQLGYVVKGFLDGHVNGDKRLLGTVADLTDVAQRQFVDEIFITIPQQRSLVKQVVLEARQLKLGVSVVPELFDGLGWNAPIHHVGDIPLMELHRESISEIGLFAKRIFDIVASSLGLVIVSPLLLISSIVIKFDSRGPVLYRAPRVGKKGRVFDCCKLRTMIADADVRKEQLRHLNERKGAFFKITDDPRVTRVGKWLRKYSVDELPQFWNILKGDMSLVGPRPHPLDDYRQYNIAHLDRLDVRPGLTGLWQIMARRDPSFEKSVALDIQYIENWSFWLDLKILVKTIPEVVRASGT